MSAPSALNRQLWCSDNVRMTRLCVHADVLAGRKTTGKTEGTVLFAGVKPTSMFLRRYTGYVEQFGAGPPFIITHLGCTRPDLYCSCIEQRALQIILQVSLCMSVTMGELEVLHGLHYKGHDCAVVQRQRLTGRVFSGNWLCAHASSQRFHVRGQNVSFRT